MDFSIYELPGTAWAGQTENDRAAACAKLITRAAHALRQAAMEVLVVMNPSTTTVFLRFGLLISERGRQQYDAEHVGERARPLWPTALASALASHVAGT